MTTRELLKRIPGLSRDTLYYWERKGWVSPTVEGARRQYSEAQVKLVERLWHYYHHESLRAEKAFERARADLGKSKR